MSNNNLCFNILSSHCWIDPSFKDNVEKNVSPSFMQQADFEPITLKQIPAIKRRRLNGLSKMAMHASLSCMEKVSLEPHSTSTVFASQHGELQRTTNIIKDMVENQEMSPKDFSLSVHNSALGLFSIFNNNKFAGTSIAADSNTFGYGLLESYNYLKRFPERQVLFTCFDLQVGAPFDKSQQKLHPSYSASLVLSLNQSEGHRMSFNFKKTKSNDPQELPLALCFFDYWYSNHKKAIISSQDTDWEFIKDAV